MIVKTLDLINWNLKISINNPLYKCSVELYSAGKNVKYNLICRIKQLNYFLKKLLQIKKYYFIFPEV